MVLILPIIYFSIFAVDVFPRWIEDLFYVNVDEVPNGVTPLEPQNASVHQFKVICSRKRASSCREVKLTLLFRVYMSRQFNPVAETTFLSWQRQHKLVRAPAAFARQPSCCNSWLPWHRQRGLPGLRMHEYVDPHILSAG